MREVLPHSHRNQSKIQISRTLRTLEMDIILMVVRKREQRGVTSLHTYDHRIVIQTQNKTKMASAEISAKPYDWENVNFRYLPPRIRPVYQPPCIRRASMVVFLEVP